MKILKFSLYVLLAILLTAVAYVAIKYPPILAGMASKTMCSCVYVMERTPESVVEKELTVFPGLNRAEFEFIDSTVVKATFGWATRTSIYRKGLGCTLLSEKTADEVIGQPVALPGALPFDADTVAWPMGDITSDSIPVGVDSEAIQAAIAGGFEETDPEKPKNTLAILVVYDGQIIGERYAEGVSKDSRLMGWSMTKSFTNALVGRLVAEGKLKLEGPAPISVWQNDDRREITLNHLMQASSGLEWDESYFFPGHFHNMFMHSDDKGGYAASQALKHPVGTHWEYSSGTTNILSKIIRQAVGNDNYPRYAYQNFFYKIGMHHTLIEPDASGTFVGSSYGYASARDWARFGLLFLHDGMVNGERILPEGWVAYSSTPAATAPKGEYGAQFWLNAGAKGNPANSHNPGLPNDEYGAEGFEEQNIFIIPSKRLIVVRLGISHHGFDMVGLTRKIIAALP